MFLGTHKSSIHGINLAFLKSPRVHVYPCGRRRSHVDPDASAATANSYYVPFDPESRLNTEANNRKHSSLNGYTQTFIHNWEDSIATFAIEGYFFTIKLTNTTSTPDDFGKALISEFSSFIDNDSSMSSTDKNSAKDSLADAQSIYANILLEKTKLFSDKSYTTEVLHNQSPLDTTASLDLFVGTDPEDENSYYFSGLSFSTTPMEEASQPTAVQQIKSMQILKKVMVENPEKQTLEPVWTLYQPSKLPKVEHGEDENSIVLGDVIADNITNKNSITTKKLYLTSDDSDDQKITVPTVVLKQTENQTYQLQFSNIDLVSSS